MTDTQRVTILVLPESSMMTLSSVLDPLRAANRFSWAPLFIWELCSPSGAAVTLSCGIKIEVDKAFTGEERGNVLFVIAGFNHLDYAPALVLRAINKAAANFATISAVEAGTWVLARAGVLRNQTVTTHWEDLENFAFAFPKLNVVNQRFVIDGKIWSSGGASPSLDMLLHYLRLNARQSLAIDVANAFIHNESPGNS